MESTWQSSGKIQVWITSVLLPHPKGHVEWGLERHRSTQQGFSGVNKISSRSTFSQARTPETELRARIVPASVLVLFWFCSGSIPGSVLVLFLALFLVLFWFSFGSVLILFWFYFSSIPGSIPGSVPGSVLFLFWLCSGSIPGSVPGSVLVLF